MEIQITISRQISSINEEYDPGGLNHMTSSASRRSRKRTDTNTQEAKLKHTIQTEEDGEDR